MIFYQRSGHGSAPTDAKTIVKIARALGPEVIERLHRQVVEVAKRAGVTHGRRFRIDTTVVATNVHYPIDSTLLQDSVRVLIRAMQRASTALGDAPGQVRNRLRSVMRRVLTISYEARSPKTRGHDPELSPADGHDACGPARCGHDGSPSGTAVRTASPHVQPTLSRAQAELQQLRGVSAAKAASVC
jgi:hypothetical protein